MLAAIVRMRDTLDAWHEQRDADPASTPEEA
jgi:hypothetical protein